MFGLINLHGVPKPTYRAYQLLHETGETRLPVSSAKPAPRFTMSQASLGLVCILVMEEVLFCLAGGRPDKTNPAAPEGKLWR